MDHKTPPVVEPGPAFADLVPDPLLTRGDVCSVTTIGPTKLKELIRAGEFPPPVQITKHRVGWRSSAVQGFIDALPVADSYRDLQPDESEAA